MRLTSSDSCNRKKHTVEITVYHYETVEEVVGSAWFSFEGSTNDIADQASKLALAEDVARSFTICRYACCQAAAAATGLRDVEEIG